VKYDVIILSYLRPDQATVCVRHILNQRPAPAKIYVWHNHPCRRKISGVINIYSESNLKCRSRHALGMLSDADACVFVDDDLFVTDTTVCNRLAEAAMNHNNAVGPFGRRCLRISNEMYHGKDTMVFNHKDGLASVAVGRMHAIQRTLIHHAFSRDLPEDVWTEDDIVLSASVEMGTKTPPMILSFHPDGFKKHRDDLGNQNRPTHYSRRNAACMHMASLGWNPLGWSISDS